MSETQQEELIVPQSAEDEDWGPSVAWRWAHARDVLNRWYNNPEHEDLRQRGYVMWDSARLIHWRILDRDWRLLPRVLKREFYGNSIDEEGLELGWPLSWK